jgi:pre-mRNA-splicing factor SYF1
MSANDPNRSRHKNGESVLADSSALDSWIATLPHCHTIFTMATPSSFWQTDCLQLIASDASFHSHEQAVAKQPYSIQAWISYMDFAQENCLKLRDFIGRRALQLMPRSYKLWKLQWEFNLQYFPHKFLTCVEAALQTLYAYPRVWMIYLQHLADDPTASVTKVRCSINRALQAVAVTQHDKLWTVVSEILLSDSCRLPVTSRVRLLQRRVSTAEPAEQLVIGEFFTRYERWGAAARLYLNLLNDSTNATTTDVYQDAWSSFLNVCSQHPVETQQAGIPWMEIVRSTIVSTTSAATNHTHNKSEVMVDASNNDNKVLKGYLWTQLADAYIRQGQFDLARGVYEEGLLEVATVRDFSILFEAYLELEQGLLEAATVSIADDVYDTEEMEDDKKVDKADDDDDWDILLDNSSASTQVVADMEWALARAEHLTSRRPLLLNSVLLRQNPHNVGEWLQRRDLFLKASQVQQAAHALEQALVTVQSSRAMNGSPSSIVVKLAETYERHFEQNEGLEKTRDVFDRICNQNIYKFKNADDLAECWVAWIELELRHEAWDTALGLVRQSVAPGGGKGKANLTRSLRLWDLLLDLEESLGTVQTTKDAYNRSLSIKAATVQHILNFASFLTEHKYFEESFTAYERGVELFAFPHAGAKVIWSAYLKAFLNRYGGSKVERTRDLFQRCLEACPPEESSEFFLLNGQFEEDYGLAKRALTVYRSMCEKVPNDDKLTAYRLFIAKSTKYLGLTSTRDIYQDAIEKLKDREAAKLCMDFSQMETNLQQFERARGILTFGAQMADPRRMPDYWKQWNEFEIAHGNEETFREMLRVKRSVEAAFSTINFNASGMTDKVKNLTDEEAMKMIAIQEGVDLATQPMTGVAGFVAGKRTATAANLTDVEERVAKLRKAAADAAVQDASDESRDDDRNEEEIDIDDIDAEIEEAAAEGAVATVRGVSTKAIPAAVFGSLVTKEADIESSKGALERLRAASK